MVCLIHYTTANSDLSDRTKNKKQLWKPGLLFLYRIQQRTLRAQLNSYYSTATRQ